MSVYASITFAIKVNSCCKNGAKHLFQLISWSRYLSTDLKEIVNPALQKKSFFCPPIAMIIATNILIAMITDDREHVRELGLRRILKAHHTTTTRSERQFRLLNKIFHPQTTRKLIAWSAENITTSPPTSNLSEKESMKYSNTTTYLPLN